MFFGWSRERRVEVAEHPLVLFRPCRSSRTKDNAGGSQRQEPEDTWFWHYDNFQIVHRIDVCGHPEDSQIGKR
jgi:hypothetical protein